MRRIFLSYNDPTGYKFAKEVLGSYEHWKRLCSKDWFSEHLEIWLQELEVKLQSEGLEKIREVAASKSTASVQASKFLAEKRWKPSNKVGRPNKDKIEQGPSDSELDEDFNRITG